MHWSNVPWLSTDAIFLSMTKRFLLGRIPHTLVTDVWGWLFTTVSSMGHDSGILVLDLQKYICTIITPEIGAYMLFVRVWNHRWWNVNQLEILWYEFGCVEDMLYSYLPCVVTTDILTAQHLWSRAKESSIQVSLWKGNKINHFLAIIVIGSADVAIISNFYLAPLFFLSNMASKRLTK